MKLFAFQPQGHGELSFFVMARSLEQAYVIVSKHIIAHLTKEDGTLMYEAKGWGTDYYKVSMLDEDEVIENDND